MTPNQKQSQVGPLIEINIYAKLYKAALGVTNGDNTNSEVMSIFLAKQDPVSTTSPVTKASPDMYRSEITKMKTQVNQLTSCVTKVMKVSKDMLAATSEENEKNRIAENEREARRLATVAAEKAKDRVAELEKEKLKAAVEIEKGERRIATQTEKERLDWIAAQELQRDMAREAQEHQTEMMREVQEQQDK